MRSISRPMQVIAAASLVALAALPVVACCEPFDNHGDRGTGIPTSMFGTYVRPGEFLVYPFFEYYRDRNFEYKPSELGYGLKQDFRGRYEASEGLIWFGYGVTDRLAVEFEMAAISARMHRAPSDVSGTPPTISESGLGDVEGQVRWRWLTESGARPEIFTLTEVVFPHHKERPLIGTADLELKLGVGAIRGFRWGTVTVRGAMQHEAGGPTDLGEVAVEYLKRLSPSWRVYGGVEGTQDEVSLITEAQWHVTDRMFIKLNNGLGLTSKATDWTPEIGVMFSLGGR